jgi:hypothetical protein
MGVMSNGDELLGRIGHTPTAIVMNVGDAMG